MFSFHPIVISNGDNTKRCRYNQTFAHFAFGSKFADEFESDEFSSQKYTMTTGSRNNKSFTLYISRFTLNQEDMDKMRDCATIDLSANEIETVSRKFFENHQQLETLILDKNFLKVLPDNVLDDIVNLRKLTLRKNYLESLNIDLFKFNIFLEYFDVSRNKLVQIHSSIFDHLTHLKFVSFRHNSCIHSAFPEESFHELQTTIDSKCGEKHLVNFIVKLMKISTLLQQGAFLELDGANIT